MPAVAIASVSSVALSEQREEVAAPSTAAGSRARKSAITCRWPVSNSAAGRNSASTQQRPEHDDGGEQRAAAGRAPPDRAAAPAAARSSRATRSRPAAHWQPGRRSASTFGGAVARPRPRRPGPAAPGPRSRRARAASRCVDRGGRAIEHDLRRRACRRCAGTTSAPGRRRAATRPGSRPCASLAATSSRTAASASVGSSADTGSSARIRSGALVQHAGDADALQLAAGEAVAAVEHAVAEVEPRERLARAGRVARQQQRGERLPGRPRAEPAGEHGGDDAQPRRNRRRLVHHADARAQGAAARRAPSCHGSAPSTSTVPAGRLAAPCRGRAAASSCPRPTGRSRPRARPRERQRDAVQGAVAVRMNEADAVAATGSWPRRLAYLIRPADFAAASMPS